MAILDPVVGTNGTNGHLGDEQRKALVVLGIFGSGTDAQAAFMAVPGATLDGWVEFDRSLLPVRAYIREGEGPYVRPLVSVDIWAGVQTPDGDCAEDAMPLEFANEARREAEAEWFERKKK